MHIDADMLLIRTNELKSGYQTSCIKLLKYDFDDNHAKLALEGKLPEIMDGINPIC